MRRRYLHWFWRDLIAATAGLVFFAFIVWFSMPASLLDRSFSLLQRRLEPSVGLAWAVALTATLLYALPSLAFGWLVHGILSWRSASRETDGETHCRACNHILRGLSEPRCPECGERI